MYLKSPMENYNKNNPFIIIAKKAYDSLVDNIQIFGKRCISYTVSILLVWTLFAIVEMYNMYITKSYVIGIIKIASFALINIGMVYNYRKKIEYFISGSPAMQEFSRLSKLEINDILALNNEELLKCVYGLYELRGELKATTRYHYSYFAIHILLGILVIISTILK